MEPILFYSSTVGFVLTLLGAYQRRDVLRSIAADRCCQPVARSPASLSPVPFRYKPAWAGVTFPTVSTANAALLYHGDYPNHVLRWYTAVLGVAVCLLVVFVNLQFLWHLPTLLLEVPYRSPKPHS